MLIESTFAPFGFPLVRNQKFPKGEPFCEDRFRGTQKVWASFCQSAQIGLLVLNEKTNGGGGGGKQLTKKMKKKRTAQRATGLARPAPSVRGLHGRGHRRWQRRGPGWAEVRVGAPRNVTCAKKISTGKHPRYFYCFLINRKPEMEYHPNHKKGDHPKTDLGQ